MKELFLDKQIRLCDSINQAKFKYIREFNKLPKILFLTTEHWGIISDGKSESECHKTTFGSIEISISKISKRSYFSDTNKMIMTIDFSSDIDDEQWTIWISVVVDVLLLIMNINVMIVRRGYE